MSALREAMSHAVLGWVKPELEETLRLARGEIESFAEDQDALEHMQQCVGYLHQVQGTLHMVELYAPAMVAEELERLAQALQERQVEDPSEASATLMRGVVLLPDYLERLQSGHRDIPIVLLPLLNEIRAARGAAGLSESVLFAPDLDGPLPSGVPGLDVLPPAVRASRFAQAQEHLERVLATWPEHGAPADAGALVQALQPLQRLVEHTAARRMVWVALSVAEAMRDGALQATPVLRQGFAGVARAVRQLQKGVVPGSVPGQEPTRQLLYQVAHSDAHHPALEDLRQTFDLAAASPSQAEVEHARSSLSGRNRALLGTVGGVVKEELMRVKDALDLYLRTGADVAGLKPQVDQLGNVADTLGMMGLGLARNVVLQQRDSLDDLVRGVRPADEGALLDIAGALLYVDASLDDQVAHLGDRAGLGEDAQAAEAQRTVETLATEAIRNFAQARQCFVGFIETGWDHAHLAEMPRLLGEVAGALRILQLEEAADLLVAVCRYIEVELIARRRVPSGSQLDTLADAMASLEYYLEALRERRPNRAEILGITRSSLEQLRYWPLPAQMPEPLDTTATGLAGVIPAGELDVDFDHTPETLEVPAELLAALGGEGQAATLAPAAPPAWALEDASPATDAPQPVAAEPASADLTLAAPAPEPVPAPAEVPVVVAPSAPAAVADAPAPAAAAGVIDVASGGFDQDAGEIDDEIRGVFIEEFDEELDNLAQMLPAWRSDLENLERLRPIRRVFHTLKGSGRLVGARLLGEFAWKVENMLNRVLDGTRAPTPAVLALLERTGDVLPQFGAALRGQAPVNADLDGLQDVADRLAAGEEALYAAPAAPPANTGVSAAEAAGDAILAATAPSAAEAVAGPEPLDGTPASVDSVLREILETEVAGHLATLRSWLSRAHAVDGAPADDELLRAFHTVNGAFAMADVPEITEVTGRAEQYVKRLLASGHHADGQGVEAIASAADAISSTVAALARPQPRIQSFAALAATLDALRDALPEAAGPVTLVVGSGAGGYAGLGGTGTDRNARMVPGEGLELTSTHDLSAYIDLVDGEPGPSAASEAALVEEPVVQASEGQAWDAAMPGHDSAPAPAEGVVPMQTDVGLDDLPPLATDVPAAAPASGHGLDEAAALSGEPADQGADASHDDGTTPATHALAAVGPERLMFEFNAAYVPVRAPADSAAPAEPLAEPESAPVEDGLPDQAATLGHAPAEAPADTVALSLSDAADTPATEAEQAFTLDHASAEPPADTAVLSLSAAADTAATEAGQATTLDHASATVPADQAAIDVFAWPQEHTDAAPAAADHAPEGASDLAGDPLAELASSHALLAQTPHQAPPDAPAAQAAAPEAAWDAAPGTVPVDGPALPAWAVDAAAPATPEPAVEALASLDPAVVDLDLVDIFVEEANDLLDHSDGLLAQLRLEPQEAGLVVGLQRDLHTIKGGARMAGIAAIGDLGHAIESLLEQIAEHHTALDGQTIGLLEHGFDVMHGMLGHTAAHQVTIARPDLVEEFVARAAGQAPTGSVLPAEQVPPSGLAPHAASQDSHAGHWPDAPAADDATDAASGDVASGLGDTLESEAADQVLAVEDALADDGLPAAPASHADEAWLDAGAVLSTDSAMPAEPEPLAGTEPGMAAHAEAPAADQASTEPEPAFESAPVAQALAFVAQAPFEAADAVADVQGARTLPDQPRPIAALPPLSAPLEADQAAGEEGGAPAPLAGGQEQVRVRADLLDRLVNYAGEVAIYRARLEQQLGAFRGAMGELDRTNVRLHDQLRRLDLETEAQIVARYQREQDARDATFDPLELDRFSTLQQLSRALGESAADITGLQGVLDDLARQYDLLLGQQSRVSSELQDGLMRARMVPFEGVVPRLRRTLRQAVQDTGKQAVLTFDGAHGELDRNVLERMTAPLEHLLRNAVAHGLESPAARLAAGKPEEGVVTLSLRREGSEMVLRVSDDGAGINHAAIRRRAEARGMLQPEAVVSDADLERLILEPGFSTAEEVSQLAGRGVGMDVVHNELRQLGGTLEIRSDTGKGTSFVLRLPQTLAVTQAVFVQVGETQFAVPVAAIGGIGRISRERFESADGKYVYGGEEYALYDLGVLVGQDPTRAEGQPQIPLLLVRAGELRAAVAVDQVLGNREIVVKPVGPQIGSIPGIYGATITGDGRVVVILDAAPLVRRQATQPAGTATAQASEERHVPLVMVVDDSLTMRKVTGRVLERHNFEVVAARDGVEALERLEERIPDLMLLDIEMPRMDGYELATAMRADARFKDVPIVMITSRTGEKHRQRAMEIGVQRYLGKPYQELDLMRNVYDLLGIARARE